MTFNARENPYRILVVERDPVLRIMLAGTLQLSGHIVVTAEDTPTPLDLLDRAMFDLAIVDVYANRPVTSAAVRTLRRAFPRLPVIVTCAGFADGGLDVADALGVAAALPKPLLPDQICETVDHLLDRHVENWTLIGAEIAAPDHRATRH
ncbi:MAG: hypothetical protein JNL66_25075 [Alphaproteobacteria bacterium]|nr:hypothetical protein [Alphaproteobacteria bacterium]